MDAGVASRYDLHVPIDCFVGSVIDSAGLFFCSPFALVPGKLLPLQFGDELDDLLRRVPVAAQARQKRLRGPVEDGVRERAADGRR